MTPRSSSPRPAKVRAAPVRKAGQPKPMSQIRKEPESRRHVEMALQILSYIRQAALKEGDHLAEQQLAHHFSVSRTPIKNGLMLLRKHGAVRSIPNLGFFVAKPVSDLYAIELTLPPSNEEQLYLRIVDDRISGRISDSVTQVEMLRHYNVNRTLLTRVLSQMADEGLTVRNPGQGWSFLPTLDSQQARINSYQFRSVVEPEMILLPEFTIDTQALEGLRRDHEALLRQEGRRRAASQEVYRLDANFHETIAGFSGNPMFVQAIQQQNRLRRMLEYRGYENRRRIASWCREHLKIIAALEQSDLATASTLMRKHLNNARETAAKIAASDGNAQSTVNKKRSPKH